MLKVELVVPLTSAVAETLRESFGRPGPDPLVLAKCLYDLPATTELQTVEVAGRVCCSSANQLEMQRDFFESVRQRNRPETAWLSDPADRRWELLRRDRHRLAFLRYDSKFLATSAFGASDLEDLRAVMPFSKFSPEDLRKGRSPTPVQGQVLLIERPHLFESAELVRIIKDQIQNGRVLLLDESKVAGCSLWLKSLEEEAGVPVLGPPPACMVEAFSADGMNAGPRVRLGQGSASAVAAEIEKELGKATVLCSAHLIETLTAALRTKRKGKSRAVSRVRFVQVNGSPSLGHVARFLEPVELFLRGQTAKVVEVAPNGVFVQAGEFRILIESKLFDKMEFFEETKTEVAVGERIRITREMSTGKNIRWPAGARFDVTAVESDGSVHLNSRRTLSPAVGTLEYDYYTPIEGSAGSVKTVVCEADDLGLVVMKGWPQRCQNLVVCARDLEYARSRVIKHFGLSLTVEEIDRERSKTEQPGTAEPSELASEAMPHGQNPAESGGYVSDLP